jgi:hypothetical protein
MLVGFSLAQDLSYDGTALWLHIPPGFVVLRIAPDG